jgi:PAS domain S-box-containing protein
VLEGREKKIRESEARLRYMLGFYEKAKGSEGELLGYAVEGAGSVTESPLGYLAFLNDDESELSMYAWSRSAMKECAIRDKPIVYKTAKTGLWGEAVRQRRAVITNDYAAPNPAKKGYPQGHPEIVRHMNVPIMDGGHIVLVAGVANKPADYTDTDVQELLLLMQSLWLVIKRRRTEGALLESEEKYRDLFENSVLGIFRTTQEGKFSAINTTFARIAGYDSPQQMMEAVRDVRTQLYVNPKDRDLFVNALKTDGFVKDFAAQYYHRDGHAIWIQINARAVRDSQGEVRYYEGTIEDITGQKNAEDALKESEDRYRNIIELLPLGMHFYELLPDGPLIFTGANPAADTILGIDNSSFIGKSIEDAFPGLVGTEIPDQYRKVAADGGVWHTDQVIYDRGEVRGAFAVQAFQIRQNAMVAVFYDITKRKQAEEALKESEEKYRTILENIQDVYYRSDAAGNLVMASPSMTGLLGYEHLDELIGKNIAGDIWLYPDRREAFIGEIKKQGFVKNYEVILKRKDGSPVTVATSSHFHYDRKGGIAGVEGIFHDITAIRNADQQINLLAALIDISPVSVTVHDADGRFLYANQRTFDLHGYTREEFMGLNLHQLDVPVSEELINERIQAIKQKGEYSFDVEHFRKDGSRFPLHVTAKITRWNDREVILSVAMDLSDRMEAERTLFESEERLQLALAGADLGTWNWNIETGEVAFNERWAGMLGYPLDEIEPNVKSWEHLVHPDDMPKVQEILAAHLEGRTEFYECEHRMRHKDGSWIWVLDKGRVIQRDTGGRPLLAAGTHLDITARKLAEEELRQSEVLYRTVIENIQDAFIRSDREGIIIMASPSAATMLGFDKPEDLIGKPMSGFYQHPEFRQVLLDKMAKDGKIVDQTIELRRKDGTVFWGSANFHCLYDTNGEMDGVEGSLHDITEYRAMERAVSEANHKLNLLNSMTRHDVTNQLTVLQGFAQIAAMKKGDPVMADYLAKIITAANTIARQIEFTRTYQELGVKAPVWTTVGEVIAHVESRVPVKFSGTCRGIEIYADPMLERVFFNLFDNAVRHGVRVTEITVRCEREPDGILVIVEDNGTGVAGAEKEKIFERGVGQNTGLGLFLVREILSITNITIKETGVYGKGARFEISVPEGMYRFVKP